MLRSAALPQVTGVAALLAAGTLGVMVNRGTSLQSGMAYLPPSVCLVVGFAALAIHFARRTAREAMEPSGWRPSGIAIFYIGVAIFAPGIWLLISAFGRHATLPVHEGLLGAWLAVLGLGVVLLGRLVGRGAL